MRIIISENQLNSLISSKGNSIDIIADSLWNAVSGLGTDEEKFYDNLKKIKSQEVFGSLYIPVESNILFPVFFTNSFIICFIP